MIFFNQKLLEEQAAGNTLKLFTLLTHHYNKKTIPSKRDKFPPSRVPIHGHSFLVNPKPFLDDKTTDILYKLQYLKLAAMRDYLLYKQYKYKALETSFYPDLNHSAISHNPLLIISPTEIKFKYEELPVQYSD
jgi:hypothetical protein